MLVRLPRQLRRKRASPVALGTPTLPPTLPALLVRLTWQVGCSVSTTPRCPPHLPTAHPPTHPAVLVRLTRQVSRNDLEAMYDRQNKLDKLQSRVTRIKVCSIDSRG